MNSNTTQIQALSDAEIAEVAGGPILLKPLYWAVKITYYKVKAVDAALNS